MAATKDEFDIGPLSWVKPEIELALRRADEGIRRFSVDPGDQETARSTLAHMHQVSGALLMVGLEPVARVSEAVEKLIDLLGRGDVKISPEIVGAARGVIAALSQYLEGLMRGDPNRPLALFPVYKAVLAAAGNGDANEVDLFYPDVTRRPKFSDSGAHRISGDELTTLLNLKRSEFQRGLLSILRGKDLPHGVASMRNALASIEATQTGAARTFWWIAVGFMEGLAGLPALEIAHKQVCGRIDLQIKRQSEGVDTISERLIRELLLAVAKIQPATGRVQEIQETYRLAEQLPPTRRDGAEDTRVKHILRELKEQLEHIKESWLKFTTGNRASLKQFVEEVARLKVIAESFPNEPLQSVFNKLGEVARNLAENPREPGEALSLETATALLMAKDAVENYYRLGPNFKSLAETAVVRVAAALKGQAVPAEGASQLADISRAAQEKMLFFQLGQEILSNLNHIEQGLDAFFRDPTKRTELANLPASINQVLGALSMLESEDAVNLMKAGRDLVQKFSSTQGPADPHDAELTAEAFSNLGLFVSALQQGRENPEELLRPVLVRLNITPSRPLEQPEPEEEAAPKIVERDLDGEKRKVAELYERWQRESHEPASRAALVNVLETLRHDAQLAGQSDLVEHAGKALVIVSDSSSHSASAVREAFVAIVGPSLLPEPQPAKPVGVVEPAPAEIDAELLEIFLEEASEVLGGIAIHRDVIASNPGDREAQTVIRRGFHTLKGSGRMVGLTDLGEVAWQVEQVMNKWLRDEKPVSKGLLRLIGDSHQSFTSWIEILKTGRQPNIQAEGIFRLADQLKNDQEPTDEGAAPAVAAPSAVETTGTRRPVEVVTTPEIPPVKLPIVEPVVSMAPEADTTPRVVIGDIVLDPEFFEIFASEANIHTATLRRELASLRSDPEQTVNHDFMRAAHTLTGICRTSGFTTIAELGFGLEKWLLDRLDHPTPFVPADMSLTEEAVEALAKMISNVLEHQAPISENALVERLDDRLHQVRAERRELEAMQLSMDEVEAFKFSAPPVVETGPNEAELLLQAEAEAEMLLAAEAGMGESSEAELMQPSEEVVSLQTSEPELRMPSEAQVTKPSELEMLRPKEPEAPQIAVKAPPPPPKTEPVATISAVKRPPSPPERTVTKRPVEDEHGEPGKDRRVIVDDVDEQLLPVFLEEAFDLLPDVGESLRAWRAAPENKAPTALLGRHLHTLKGSARMAGVMRLGELAHILENRFIEMQAAAQPAAADFEALEEGFDRFNVALERLKTGERINVFPMPVAPPVAAETPSLAVAESVATPAAVPEAAVATVPKVAAALHGEESVDRRGVLRVRADFIDRFVNDAGEISIARSRIEGEMNSFRQGLGELTENVIKLRAQLREIEIQAESQIQSSTLNIDQVGDTFDPLEFDRFTRMQELTRFMTESLHDFQTLQQSLTKNLDEVDAAMAAQSRLNRDLQQDLMSVRMVPMGNLSDRFYRIVRQTAKELGKKANLELKGMRTELDRSVLEQIVAPFEHLLRNALSHGVELPEKRVAAGKSPTGEIVIDARQQANEIVLTFTDDGGGIDVERVRQKAVEQGLLSPDERPDDSHLIDYIFMPGFSTAKEISQVAGRGVGMDVVKNAIVTLGGRIEVETNLGKGTKFVIILPLTLAVTQVLLIRANGTLYGVPSAMVDQVQQWKMAEISALREKQEIFWRENRYPFHLLSYLLGEEEKASEPRRYFPVLLLRSGVHRAAVEIDSIEGNREIVVKAIGPQLSRLTGIGGATVLGNGQVVLILNPVVLSERQEGLAAGPVKVKKELVKEAVVAKAPTVMVVDDSLTVRKITTRLLQREGYQVVTAKDGVDALQQLQEFVPDIMLLDVEMPRMDGFELTRNMRGDDRLRGIPIIMITSRTAEKHRNFALGLGVNEYLGKPYQEDELLGHINRFIGKPVLVH